MSRNVRRVALFLLLFLVLVTGMAAGSSGPGRIVFVSVRDTYSDIYVMNADGSGQTRLTNNPGLDYFSGWGRAPLVTADFTANITTGIAPLPVQFNDTSAVVNPTDWSWDFGDGNVTNATRQNPVHTYISAGNFTVSLNASNAAGSNLTTKAKYIKVTSGLAPTPTKIGVFRNSTRQWLLDYNGNGIWDGAPTDKVYKYILSTDTPVSGKWS